MRVDPESVYFEPTQVWTFNRAESDLKAPLGLSVHAKIGKRYAIQRGGEGYFARAYGVRYER